MRTVYNSSNYNNDLRLTKADALTGCHSGACDSSIAFLRQKPYIRKQLATLDPDQLRKELQDYGAWSTEELSNHEENLTRWLWISCGDIVDGK